MRSKLIPQRNKQQAVKDHPSQVGCQILDKLSEDEALKPDEDFEPMPIPEKALAKERARVKRNTVQ